MWFDVGGIITIIKITVVSSVRKHKSKLFLEISGVCPGVSFWTYTVLKKWVVVVQIGSLVLRPCWGAFEIESRTCSLATNLLPECRIPKELVFVFILSFISTLPKGSMLLGGRECYPYLFLIKKKFDRTGKLHAMCFCSLHL